MSEPAQPISEVIAGYRTVLGSDVQRDGMYLELIDEATGDEIAEIFYSDETHTMTISVFCQVLPLQVVELLIEQAKRRLPPQESPESPARPQ